MCEFSYFFFFFTSFLFSRFCSFLVKLIVPPGEIVGSAFVPWERSMKLIYASGSEHRSMVNNAGLGFESTPMHEMEEQTWDSLM